MKRLSDNIGRILNQLRKMDEQADVHTMVACALDYDITLSNKELCIIAKNYLDKTFTEEQMRQIAYQLGYNNARKEYWHNKTAKQYAMKINRNIMPDDIKACVDELQEKLQRMFGLLQDQDIEPEDTKYYILLEKLLKKMKNEYC